MFDILYIEVSTKFACSVVVLRRIMMMCKLRLVGRFGAIPGGDVQAEKAPLRSLLSSSPRPGGALGTFTDKTRSRTAN